MSDFFSDDFTAELKAYFLDNLSKECDKFLDLVDDKLWKRISTEVCDAAKTWAVDAKTNEFEHLASWFENIEARMQAIENEADLKKSIQTIKKYVEALKHEKDSPELAAQFVDEIHEKQSSLFLHCLYGSQSFAIPLLNVIEICSDLPLYKLPQKKPGLLGVIPFRGEAVPVISFMDFGFGAHQHEKLCYVICEHENVRLSLQVTKTDDLVSLQESDIFKVDGENNIIQASFVNKFFIKENKNVMILDFQKMVAA